MSFNSLSMKNNLQPSHCLRLGFLNIFSPQKREIKALLLSLVVLHGILFSSKTCSFHPCWFSSHSNHEALSGTIDYAFVSSSHQFLYCFKMGYRFFAFFCGNIGIFQICSMGSNYLYFLYFEQFF